MMPFSTRLARPASIFATPASTNRCSTSRATTTWPASRHTWAIPAPIVPSPTTPTVPIDTRLPPLASAVIVLAAEAGNRRSAGYTGSMARFRDRLRMGTRDRNDAVVIDDGPGTEIIVLDAVEEIVDGVEAEVLAATEPYPAATRRALRRQRQALVGGYERQIIDLGGLVVEMARRGVHNHALVERRAADVVELERHIAELDGRLLAAAEVRRGHVAVPPLMAQIEAPAGRPPRPARRATRCSPTTPTSAPTAAPRGSAGDGRRSVRGGCSSGALPELPRRRRARPAVLPAVRRAARSPTARSRRARCAAARSRPRP